MKGRRVAQVPADHRPTKIEAAAEIWLGLKPHLDESPRVCREMFATLIEQAPNGPTTVQLVTKVGTSTLVSRFHRAGLPSMKTYHDRLRLLYALAFLERIPRATVQSVAHDLNASSAQAFGRSWKRMTGRTVSEYRSRTNFDQALADFAEQLLRPFLPQLRRFLPLAKVSRW